jgi:hypothetical protein
VSPLVALGGTDGIRHRHARNALPTAQECGCQRAALRHCLPDQDILGTRCPPVRAAVRSPAPTALGADVWTGDVAVHRHTHPTRPCTWLHLSVRRCGFTPVELPISSGHRRPPAADMQLAVSRSHWLADPPAGVRANRATSTLTWPHLTHEFARAVLDISVLEADELPPQAESIGA